MSQFFRRILGLVERGEVVISDHGYDELAEDGILVKDLLERVADGIVVEEYPDYYKGPCALILQRDHDGRPVHVVWGIPGEAASPAVVVTAYRPNPARWPEDFTRRRT